MIFQHRCRVMVEPEDILFARRAMCTPGMVTPGEDLVMGETTLWDGSTISIQLRGISQKPAIMIFAVFDHNDKFVGGVQSTSYCTGLDFDVNDTLYMVSICEEKTLAQPPKDAVEPPPPPLKAKNPRKRGTNSHER